jgi:hypothetical protein
MLYNLWYDTQLTHNLTQIMQMVWTFLLCFISYGVSALHSSIYRHSGVVWCKVFPVIGPVADSHKKFPNRDIWTKWECLLLGMVVISDLCHVLHRHSNKANKSALRSNVGCLLRIWGELINIFIWFNQQYYFIYVYKLYIV